MQIISDIRGHLHPGTEQPMRASLQVVPVARAQTTTGASTLSFSAWTADRLATSFERTLDEIENTMDRFALLRQREQQAPKNVRITIEILSGRNRIGSGS
jgi:hypothetical protein